MTEDRYPLFWQLAQAYFHQDWAAVSGPSWEHVIDHWLRDGADDRDDLVSEIQDILEGCNPDAELFELLRSADLGYHLELSEARPWLTAVRNRLVSSDQADPLSGTNGGYGTRS